MVKSPPTCLCSLLFTAISGVSQPSGRVQAEHCVWILSAPDSVMGCRRSAETRGTSKHGGFLSHGGYPQIIQVMDDYELPSGKLT